MKLYHPLINEWKSAFNNFISGNYNRNEKLSFSFYSMSLKNPQAYYALYDIDGNGTPELILRKVDSYEDIIAYIFTIKDGEAINIFGNDFMGRLREVPWSRHGASVILSNGLIDSTNGDFTIYKMTDDGYDVAEFASMEPYDYPDEASLALAKWRYYVNYEQVDYDTYDQYLNLHGYKIDRNNELAKIDWVALG